MVRGSVDVPVDTETPYFHSSGLGALCAVAEDEIRGSSSHSPPMQVLSDVLWNGTQAKPAQTCQLTAQSTSEQDAAVTAQLSCPLAQLHGCPWRTCSTLLSSRAVFPVRVSPGLYHFQFPLLNLGVGEPTSFQNLI